jgi:hypothetical protein
LRAVLSGAEEAMTTFAERMRQEGALTAQRRMVEHLLTLKFGERGAAQGPRLEDADAEALTRYAARILNASSVEEVFDSEH